MTRQRARYASAAWREEKKKAYMAFDQLDGTHPWQKALPEGYINYSVRKLHNGSVAYLNYGLAKEMGLIPKDHPERMNKELEKKLLETFCLRIINEWDIEHNVKFPAKDIKPNKYMATRYLQLQHDDKLGRTSGDGRCVWNGVVQYNGTTWDVSSRGTGVTSLAPGAVEAGHPLKSGSTDFGYGCGLAEIDELYGSAIMSEIMHLNSINTERMLVIIDLGGGVGIGVRAGKNLFRPAHLFMFLKQREYDSLKRATDFLIDRQNRNGQWNFGLRHKSRYRLMLEEVCESFAQMVAQLDREYIFAWLDWDGDNVLATAGIIDYGSVRQFGLRHDQYRYDDVDRFSTNLNEQKAKAKLTVQVFAQLVDYLTHGECKALTHFRDHRILKEFDKHYDYYLLDHFLYQIGFIKKQRIELLKSHRRAVKTFFDNFSYFESMKTHKKMQTVADGVNRPAIFNMRIFLNEMAQFCFENKTTFAKAYKDEKELFKSMLSEFAGRKDSKITRRIQTRLHTLQTQYKNLLTKTSPGGILDEVLSQVSSRSKLINRADRVTGNALINIVSELIKKRKEGMADKDIQKIMDSLIQTQVMRPESIEPEEAEKLHKSLRKHKLGRVFLTLIDGYKEDI